MSKRFALPLVAALALVSVSARSFGAAPPPNNDDVCLSMSYTVNNQQVPVSLTYDTTTGVVVEIRRVDFSTVYAALPITVGDEPNPHFDRLYALLMKGFDSARIERVCVDRQPSEQNRRNRPSWLPASGATGGSSPCATPGSTNGPSR